MQAATKSVLIVDDAPEIREAVADVVSDEGMSPVLAADGLEAKELLEAGLRPCVILLDLLMPRMTGQEFLAWLRASPAPLDRLPVVVLTASVQGPVPAADVVLRKPVSLTQLLGALERCRGP